jgi:glycosidase
MQVQTPDWVKHAVFYQIFPDRFAKRHDERSLLSTDNTPFEPWDDPPTLQGYKGGNLWGAIDKLDYLKDLGITAIYLTPIFQSASNHRYHTHDYYQVDPILGGNEAFGSFLEEAHRRDMKVVIDGVFNHASRGFYFFNDILENGPYSPWLDWFRVEKWPLSAYDGNLPANYISWVGNRALPQFNHDNPEVREYIMKVGEHWIRMGIDGWRLDVPFEVKTPGFWVEFRDRIKAINPEAYIVGEVWTDAEKWLDGTQFDAVMNYEFTGPTIAYTAGDRVIRELVEHHDYYPYPALDAQGYAAKMQSLLQAYPWEIQLAQMNLLDSHDTPRMLTLASDDLDSLKLAVLLKMTFPGAPCLYYGDEVGVPGGHDPDCRRTFPEPEHWNRDLLDTYRQLIGLRHQYTALRIGSYEVLLAEGDVYAFARSLDNEEAIVAVNAGTTTETLTLEAVSPDAQPLQLCFGDERSQSTFEMQDGKLSLELSPRSGCILARSA